MNVYVGLRDALDATKRQFDDYVHRLRRECIGYVVQPERGILFITGSDCAENYFNRDNVVSLSFERLNVGVKLNSLKKPPQKGRTQSASVLVTTNYYHNSDSFNST